MGGAVLPVSPGLTGPVVGVGVGVVGADGLPGDGLIGVGNGSGPGPGPGGTGGWFSKILTAIHSAIAAIASTRAKDATYVHRLAAVTALGQGSGHIRHRPTPRRPNQWGRKPGPAGSPTAGICSRVTVPSSALAAERPSAQLSAGTATHGAMSTSESAATRAERPDTTPPTVAVTSEPASTPRSGAAAPIAAAACWNRARA